MSYHIRVICQSDRSVRRAEICEFVMEGVYFDPEPTFDPAQSSAEQDNEDWTRLVIHYQRDKRPIVVECTRDPMLFGEEIGELSDELSDSAGDAPTEVRDALAGCRQVIAFDVDPSSLTEDAWAMLDCLECHLARMRNGIVYAPDDGYYDQDLKAIYRL